MSAACLNAMQACLSCPYHALWGPNCLGGSRSRLQLGMQDAANLHDLVKGIV